MRHILSPYEIFVFLLVGAGYLSSAIGSPAHADHPTNAEVLITFDRVYTGSYRTGEPYDYVTIQPDGGGESFGEMGIEIRIRLNNLNGDPLVGIPANEIVLRNESLCFCESKIADRSTDLDGWTSFSGTISGGGCAQGLDLFAAGFPLGTIPININSPDTGLATPGFTDSGDLAYFAATLGASCN